jgi:predicted nuclease of predicted toxin-antitoxin system
MPLAHYTDKHIPTAITDGLASRGIDLLRIEVDGGRMQSDAWVLERAHSLGRVVFTMDEDFLVLAAVCQRTGVEFSGIVYAHQMRYSIGQIVERLGLLCREKSLESMRNRVVFL